MSSALRADDSQLEDRAGPRRPARIPPAAARPPPPAVSVSGQNRANTPAKAIL